MPPERAQIGKSCPILRDFMVRVNTPVTVLLISWGSRVVRGLPMKKLIAIGVFALAYCGGAFAQVAGMGAISGTVRDASGAVVPDAQVVVSNESKGIKRSLHTTEAGVFAAPSLIPAEGYLVQVSKQGFS